MQTIILAKLNSSMLIQWYLQKMLHQNVYCCLLRDCSNELLLFESPEIQYPFAWSQTSSASLAKWSWPWGAARCWSGPSAACSGTKMPKGREAMLPGLRLDNIEFSRFTRRFLWNLPHMEAGFCCVVKQLAIRWCWKLTPHGRSFVRMRQCAVGHGMCGTRAPFWPRLGSIVWKSLLTAIQVWIACTECWWAFCWRCSLLL